MGSIGFGGIVDSKPLWLNKQTSLINPGFGMISLLIPRSFDAPLNFLYLGKEVEKFKANFETWAKFAI